MEQSVPAKETVVVLPNVHVVKKGDPRVDGPYLDDVKAERERALRERRNAKVVETEDK